MIKDLGCACLSMACKKAGEHIKTCPCYGFEYPKARKQSISLCKNCNCMTKTIKAKCGKCGARKLNNQNNWIGKNIYDLLDSKLMESLTDEQWRAIEDIVVDIIIPQSDQIGYARGKESMELINTDKIENTWEAGLKEGRRQGKEEGQVFQATFDRKIMDKMEKTIDRLAKQK